MTEMGPISEQDLAQCDDGEIADMLEKAANDKQALEQELPSIKPAAQRKENTIMTLGDTYAQSAVGTVDNPLFARGGSLRLSLK